ncbi:MAG: hypothetical protein ACYCWW_06200 [Deltaproteobacteria bacterium]
MIRVLAFVPLWLVFAFAGPWTCSNQYSTDGGAVSPINPHPGSGGGGGGGGGGGQSGPSSLDGGTASTDAGQSIGVVNGPDGGVTLGPAANFTSNFAWVANEDGTVSMVDTDTQSIWGRYPAAIPVDMAGTNTCSGGPGYTSSMSTMLSSGYHSCEGTSRTVVDLNGGVFAANRVWSGWCFYDPGNYSAPGSAQMQPSVTHIANSKDHLIDPFFPNASCKVRCPGRNGGLPVTSHQIGGGVIAPWSSAYTGNPALWCPDPNGTVVYDGGTYDDPTSSCNPVNYDDCALFTVPIGGQNGWNQNGVNTTGSWVPRGEVISSNCDPLSRDCDMWVGLSNGGLMVRLSAVAPPGTATACGSGGSSFVPFTPTAAIGLAQDDKGNQIPVGGAWSGSSPYGAAIDCRGWLWADNPGGGPQPVIDTSGDQSNGHMLYAIDTTTVDQNPRPPPVTQFTVLSNSNTNGACDNQGTCNGLTLPSGVNGLPQCGSYGMAIDGEGKVWTAGFPYGLTTCSFDPNVWLKNAGGLNLSYPDYPTAVSTFGYGAAFTHYDFNSYQVDNDWARGVVADRFGNIFLSMSDDQGGGFTGVLGFTPQGGGASSLLWTPAPDSPSAGNDTVGVDLAVNPADPQGTTAATSEYLWGVAYTGTVSEYDVGTGANLANVQVNAGTSVQTYTYSDFTGYALRYITAPNGAYSQIFQANNGAPEFTVWTGINFSYSPNPLPSGDDIIVQVRVANTLGDLSTTCSTEVCDVAKGCTSPVNLTPYNLQGAYMAVIFTLKTPGCTSLNNTVAPTLWSVSATNSGPGN